MGREGDNGMETSIITSWRFEREFAPSTRGFGAWERVGIDKSRGFNSRPVNLGVTTSIMLILRGDYQVRKT